MKKFSYFGMLLSLCACQSTRQGDNFSYNDYPIDTIDINSAVITKALDSTEYSIEQCFPLERTTDVPDIYATDVQLFNNRIYILDEKVNKTVFVYDSVGHLLHKLGQIGHARNEYIGGPTCFSIDPSNGNVHIYERKTARLLVFNPNGSYLKTVHFDLVPERVCITNTGNYLCSFCTSQYNIDKLALYNQEGKRMSSIIPSENTENLYQWNCFFTNNGTTYYNPPMTDFVLRINNDTVQNVFKLDFGGKYVSEEFVKEAQEKDDLELILKHKGVQFVEQAQITDKLIHIIYANNRKQFHYLQNRATLATHNNNNAYYCGIWPESNFWISGDRIIYIVSKEKIEQINSFVDKSNKKTYNQTKGVIKKVLNGTIPAPLYISICLNES